MGPDLGWLDSCPPRKIDSTGSVQGLRQEERGTERAWGLHFPSVFFPNQRTGSK